jgi:hypothetical protein
LRSFSLKFHLITCSQNTNGLIMGLFSIYTRELHHERRLFQYSVSLSHKKASPKQSHTATASPIITLLLPRILPVPQPVPYFCSSPDPFQNCCRNSQCYPNPYNYTHTLTATVILTTNTTFTDTSISTAIRTSSPFSQSLPQSIPNHRPIFVEISCTS